MYKYRVAYAVVLLSVTLLISGIGSVSAVSQDKIFSLHLLASPTEETKFNIARILQSEFSKIGIDVEIEATEGAVIGDIVYSPEYYNKPFEEGGWDMLVDMYWWWPKDYVWFKGCYHSSGLPPHGWNYWGWQNGLADLHLEKGLTTYDEEERIEHLKKWQEIFSEDLPHANIWWPLTPQITKEPLKGVNGFLWTHNAYQWRWADEREDTTVVYAVRESVRNLNPLFLNGSYFWVEPQYDPLYKVFYDGEKDEYYYASTMASDFPELSEDGLTATIQIREGVKWHDGEPMTAEDVKFTFDAILDPETGAGMHGDFAGIIESVEVRDRYTVDLQLKGPVPYLTSLLTAGSTSILPEHVLGDVPHAELRAHSTNTDIPAPGTGPYQFEDWQKGEAMELVANDEYVKGPPQVERILIRVIPEPTAALMALESGEVDALSPYHGESLSGEIKRLEKEPGIEVELFASGAIGLLAFNTNHPILNNKYVRQALTYAIPREHITQNILHGLGQPANSPVPPFWFAYNEELPAPEYNLDKARELLRKAGYNPPS